MSRSVSAPSSVTNTSPCWNGLIVPGSTLRYGSNFWSCTRRPRDLSSRPSEAATMPFPSAETTPPVTKTYFGARALTGFKGSSATGRRRSRLLARPQQQMKPVERAARKCPPEADVPRPVDDEGDPRPALVDGLQGQLGVDAVDDQPERDSAARDDVDDLEHSGRLRPSEVARLHRPDH